MRTVILILILISQHCYAQGDYNANLSAKLKEIRELTYFDNGVVILDDSSGYGSTFPYWTPAVDFSKDDVVSFKGGIAYQALVDNKGNNPSTSRKEWRLYYGPHPYLFLRDTAKTEDLKALLTSDHAYIRIYAFGALAYRKSDNLFQVVIDNLHDTTKIEQMTSDYGYTVSPADLMIWYTRNGFSREQKDILKKLILRKYTHLNTLEEILLFHTPANDTYPAVKSIVNKGIAGKFGLIALSQYCKSEDIEIIKTGFNLDAFSVYYEGYKVFFKAIENCPNKAFKLNLIDSKSYGDPYYFNALAAYRDKDCLKVLEDFVNLKPDEKKSNWQVYDGNEHLKMIYQALKKYYTPMYDALIAKIRESISNNTELELYENRLENSPWNY